MDRQALLLSAPSSVALHLAAGRRSAAPCDVATSRVEEAPKTTMRPSVLHLSRSATAVALARSFVAGELTACGLPELTPDAELAVSELVTNGLLHTEGELSVRVVHAERCVRVEVWDESPLVPLPSLLQRTGMSGRGLLLVARLTSDWGSEPVDGGKVVWFEMCADHVPGEAELTVDDLLTMWDFDDEPAPRGADYRAERDVLVTGLPTRQLVEVKARTEDLGREMALILGQSDGRPSHLLRVARRLDRLMHDLAPMRMAIRAQALAAANRGDPLVDVALRVAIDDAEHIEAYAESLDEADELAKAGQLLTVPASGEIGALRRSYLREIAAQVRGRPAHPGRRPGRGPAHRVGPGLTVRG